MTKTYFTRQAKFENQILFVNTPVRFIAVDGI